MVFVDLVPLNSKYCQGEPRDRGPWKKKKGKFEMEERKQHARKREVDTPNEVPLPQLRNIWKPEPHNNQIEIDEQEEERKMKFLCGPPASVCLS